MSWSLCVGASPREPEAVADWHITRTTGEAPSTSGRFCSDAAAAIKRAIRKYDVASEHQDRVAACPIVTVSEGSALIFARLRASLTGFAAEFIEAHEAGRQVAHRCCVR